MADLRPGERLVDGEILYSAAFLNDRDFDDPNKRVEATTTPEGAKGWDSGQARHDVPGGGHSREVAPDAQPEGVRAETRRLNDRAGGEPSNAPVAADSDLAAAHATVVSLQHLIRELRHELDNYKVLYGDIYAPDSPAMLAVASPTRLRVMTLQEGSLADEWPELSAWQRARLAWARRFPDGPKEIW